MLQAGMLSADPIAVELQFAMIPAAHLYFVADV
jgi:hypothetical protein